VWNKDDGLILRPLKLNGGTRSRWTLMASTTICQRIADRSDVNISVATLTAMFGFGSVIFLRTPVTRFGSGTNQCWLSPLGLRPFCFGTVKRGTHDEKEFCQYPLHPSARNPKSYITYRGIQNVLVAEVA
jgi:hypothetical protein